MKKLLSLTLVLLTVLSCTACNNTASLSATKKYYKNYLRLWEDVVIALEKADKTAYYSASDDLSNYRDDFDNDNSRYEDQAEELCDDIEITLEEDIGSERFTDYIEDNILDVIDGASIRSVEYSIAAEDKVSLLEDTLDFLQNINPDAHYTKKKAEADKFINKKIKGTLKYAKELSENFQEKLGKLNSRYDYDLASIYDEER